MLGVELGEHRIHMVAHGPVSQEERSRSRVPLQDDSRSNKRGPDPAATHGSHDEQEKTGCDDDTYGLEDDMGWSVTADGSDSSIR